MNFKTLIIFYFVRSVFCVSKLLIVSFDGFRFDYFNRNETPYLNQLSKEGTYSKFLLSVFPTQTFTNHFTIATGLYSESHGVLASSVYDEKQKVLLNYSYPLFHYNEDVMPIWTLNQKAGPDYHSGVMMWPGSSFQYNNINTTFMQKYDKSIPWEERVKTVITWFKHPKTPANLVMMYFEEPDLESHAFGPDSKEVNAQIKRVDKISRYLMNELKVNNLVDINVILLSDHGMETVYKRNIIDLSSLLSICDMYGTSPVLQVYPKKGMADLVYQQLQKLSDSTKHFKVYKKQDIPVYLHYKNCGRTPPILISANPGYAFQDLFAGIDWYKQHFNVSEDGPFGVHGYEPSTIKMHPFFIAKGPVFKSRYIPKSQIESVDLFLLFSHILQLKEPPIKSNGTRSHFSDIFVLEEQSESTTKLKIVFAVSSFGVFLVWLAVFITFIKFRRKIRNSVASDKPYLPAVENVNEAESQQLLLDVSNEDASSV